MKTKSPQVSAPAPTPKIHRPGISAHAMHTLVGQIDELRQQTFDEAGCTADSLADLIEHHPALQQETRHLRAIAAARDYFNDLSSEATRL